MGTFVVLTRVLAAVAILKLQAVVGRAPVVEVSSFAEFEDAIVQGAVAIDVVAVEITFPRPLELPPRGTVSITSSMFARLSGGDLSQLFIVTNVSTLSLENVELTRGAAFNGTNGGSIYVGGWSSLSLKSCIVSENTASLVRDVVFVVVYNASPHA
jgi:hypothetical protein